MKNYLPQLFIFVLLFSLASCENGFDDSIDTKREIAVPLFFTTTSLPDLLDGINEETSVTIGADGLIILNYKGNVTQRTGNELFNFIPPIIVPLEDSITNFPFELPGTLDFTLTKIKDGLMIVQFKNTLAEQVDVTVTIPELTKNGVPVMLHKLMNANSEWIQPLPLKDHILETNNDDFSVIYQAYRQSDGERIEFSETPGLGINGLQFSYAEGFWGQELLDLERDTIEIEFFENWVQGEVFFEDPVIQITVENGFGFPVRSVVNLLDILTVDNTTISLESPFIDDGIDFAYPSLAEVGESKTTVFDFNKDNSNVVQVLRSGPVSVDYDVDAVSNPDMLPELGFMTDSSFFQVQVAVELPFRGHVNNFEGRDTFNVNFENYDEVDYVEFKMVAENAIPLAIDIQIYFLDEQNNVIDSLYTLEENIIASAPVDSDGEVTGEIEEKITYATLDATQFEKIRNAKKLLVEGIFRTTGVENTDPMIVSLRADQEVNIRMGMKLGTK